TYHKIMKVFVYFLPSKSMENLKDTFGLRLRSATEYPKAVFVFFSFLIKKRNKRNQERTPTPIFFGAHSAGTPEKIVVLTVRPRPRALLLNSPD
ncbi:MAG: hypothetical protein V4580_12785, partial [Bacteroidota bacterium]